jgi:hypothetical protein
MTPWLRNNLPIVVAFTLSVLLHVFVLFPALGIMGGGDHAADAVEGASLERETEEPRDDTTGEEQRNAGRDDAQARDARSAETARRALQERRNRDRALPREEQEEVKLGIDESTATTMSWIGYEEYQQHLAELAEVEQAAFRLEVAAGSRGSEQSPLPPAEPAPSVAISPNPSPLPLPAGEAGSTAPLPTNLVLEPAKEPSSTPPATSPTEPSVARGSDAERAVPLSPPEPPAANAPEADPASGDAPPSESGTEAAGPATKPQDEPRTDPSSETPTPTDPNTLPPKSPSDGTKPVPTPPDPTRTDPNAEPRTDPSAEPDPAEIDPSKPLNPAAPGAAPNVPPRDNADPSATTVRPPNEAPEQPTEPSPEPNPMPSSESTPNAENSVSTKSGTQGGGIPGPVPVDGSQNTPAQPSPAGAPGDTVAPAGELSDRESDPTSIIDVPMANWQNGRPLAAKGITLKPVRPRFTTLNYVDGVARNPIGELVIGRDGIPQAARLVRSTGNGSVDEAIRNALYKWRASGKQLEKLKPGQTVTIRLRMIMLVD